MKHVYNDGGRAAAGFTGKAGDCVTRAIAIATGLPYQAVYDRLAAGNATQRHTSKTKGKKGRRSASNGIYTKRKWFNDYMLSLGFEWVSTMGIGTGCTVHLKDGELPMGRLVVSVSRHMCAVIDGVIHDTHDPNDRGGTIYPPSYTGNVPKGAVWLENGNGWLYKPDRCVYGYYKLKV